MRTISLLIVLAMAGCTSAERAKYTSFGHRHRVQLYSGGKVAAEWTSKGRPMNEEESDGYYFSDVETGQVVEVSGDIVITELP